MQGMLKRIVIVCSALLILVVLAKFAHADLFQTYTPANSDNSSGSSTNIAATPPDTLSYADALFNSTDQPAWQTRTDLFYDFQQKNTPVFGFETIQPLYECCGNNFFGQGRGGYTDGGVAFNLGLGYRYLTANKKLMLGINTFYDEIFRYPHKRVGLGGEVFTPYITLRANFYDAYTGQRYTGNNTYERASSGFDAGIETPVPYISWMRFTLKGYYWKGNRAPNVTGGLVNLRVYPARQVELAVGYANDNSQHSQAFINLNYYFGSPDFIQYSASTCHPSPLFAAQDLEKIHLEKVLRTNEIVVEKRQGLSQPTIVARTD